MRRRRKTQHVPCTAPAGPWPPNKELGAPHQARDALTTLQMACTAVVAEIEDTFSEVELAMDQSFLGSICDRLRAALMQVPASEMIDLGALEAEFERCQRLGRVLDAAGRQLGNQQ